MANWLTQALYHGYVGWNSIDQIPATHMCSTACHDDIKTRMVTALLDGDNFDLSASVPIVKHAMQHGFINSIHFAGVDDFTRMIMGVSEVETATIDKIACRA